MTKRKFLVLGLLVMAASFAQPIGFGLGAYGYLNSIGFKTAELNETKYDPFVGAQLFFDMTYLEATLGIAGNWIDGTRINMDFGIFLKLPIEAGEASPVKMFPLIGLEFDSAMSRQDSAGNEFGSIQYTLYYYENGEPGSEKIKLSAFNNLWFKAGFGADIPLGGVVFLRTEFLVLGIGPLNRVWKNMKEEVFDESVEVTNLSGTVKFSLGFQF